MPSKHLKPLSQLFRPPASPPHSPVDHSASLGSASPEQLAAIALGDSDEALRAAAIERLPDGEILRKLAGLRDASANSPELQPFARKRVAALIDSGAIDVAGFQDTPSNPAAVLGIAELCNDPALLEHALSSIQDSLEIERLVVEGSSIRLRQCAAQRIEGSETLNRLLKQLQGKDKSVYRILKDKRDALRADARQSEQLDSDIRTVCASLEALAARPYEPLHVPAFEIFETRWRKLEGQAQPWARQRAHLAIERCRELIGAHQQHAEEQAALLAHQAAGRAARQAAREEAAAQAAEAARRRDEEAALAAAETEQSREAAEKHRAERQAAEALALRRIGALLTKAHGALRAGQTGPAAGIRRAIGEKVTSGPALPPALARQLQELDSRLEALKGWKDFAATPKRAELITEMEALVGSSEAPKKLAERIRDLRAQWKTISQGVFTDSEADWQRFNQAALSAYEPCREYFEAQAKVRAENLERRQHVLQRLLNFETSQSVEHPDWRTISVVLHEAREEWRRIAPVDRDAVRPAQAEFDASLTRLYTRLDAWHAQNAADKQALIERAKALLTKDDSRAATDAAKTLQHQWKDIGPALRHQEGALWNEFRGHCDVIFQKRDQAYAEYAASLEGNKIKAVALCEEAEQIADQSGPVLIEAAKNITQLRTGFEAIGELPRTEERALYTRFERALKLCETRISQQHARDAAQAYENLLEAARLINSYGWAVAQGAEAPVRELLKVAAETFIAGAPQMPKGSAPALKEAWAKAESASAPGADTNQAALRMLCVRSEIFGDRPTPAEDQDLRRSYQLQRLVQGMGKWDEEAPNDWEALALEWVRAGPVALVLYESLLARFLLCRRNPADQPR